MDAASPGEQSKYPSTNKASTQVQTKQVPKYKQAKYPSTNKPSTQVQAKQVPKYKQSKYLSTSKANTHKESKYPSTKKASTHKESKYPQRKQVPKYKESKYPSTKKASTHIGAVDVAVGQHEGLVVLVHALSAELAEQPALAAVGVGQVPGQHVEVRQTHGAVGVIAVFVLQTQCNLLSHERASQEKYSSYCYKEIWLANCHSKAKIFIINYFKSFIELNPFLPTVPQREHLVEILIFKKGSSKTLSVATMSR